MTATVTDAPRVVHSLPGRTRVHLPRWSGAAADQLERGVSELPGVRTARASPRTRNVLVHFDGDALDEDRILAALDKMSLVPTEQERRRSEPDRPAKRDEAPVATRRDEPPVATRRARIAVRGLDSDPNLARTIFERFAGRAGIARVSASVLTGRVLFELADPDMDFEDFAAELHELEPAGDADHEPPNHPLDPAPLIEGSTKLIGSALGLGLILARRATGTPEPPVRAVGPAEAAALVGLAEATPPLVQRIEGVLGHEGRELLFGSVSLVSLTFSGGALGLAVAGLSGARLLTEALAKRAAWQDYEARVADFAAAHPGSTVRLEAGERMPLPGRVVEGFGTAARMDGLPAPLAPGRPVEAGARLYGGPFEIELESDGHFDPQPRSRAPTPSALDRYMAAIGPASLACALVTGLLTRSAGRAFTALMLVNPRAALLGAQTADRSASARVLRSGVTVVGSRGERPIHRPDVLVVDSARVLADGWEHTGTVVLDDEADPAEVARTAAWISAAAGSPWGNAFRTPSTIEASDGTFDGEVASAEVGGERWRLGPAGAGLSERVGDAEGQHVLALWPRPDAPAVALLTLRPRPAAGAEMLVDTCRAHDVRVDVLSAEPSPAAETLARRTGAELVVAPSASAWVRRLQGSGRRVAVLSDGAHAAEAFDASDLAIGRTSGRRGLFLARADLLAPALEAVSAVIEAGARRDAAVRDSTLLAVAANGAGATWGLRASPTVATAMRPTNIASLAAIAVGYGRLRGGRQPRSVAERLVDPVPERWGRESAAAALRAFGTTADGLSSDEAARRWQPPPQHEAGSPLVRAVLDQFESPLTAVMATGAAISLGFGAFGDALIIAAAIGLNVAVGTWQQHQASEASTALERLGARTATVLRDGRTATVQSGELVPGDVLVLHHGRRVAADARVIAADRLEVDEAALTGESFPVAKAPRGGTDASHVLLEGSDVTTGTGRAVVVAVGSGTRMGAIAAALAVQEQGPSPLDERLSRILRRGVPFVLAAGALVTVAGVLWGNPLGAQAGLGASIAVGAVPDGLPLLAGVAQAGVAGRLARRRAVVSRLSAVEALGRVDVACADKTGTMTEGRPTVTRILDAEGRGKPVAELTAELREVLLAAALASPHPDAADARAHPTDVAVQEAAERGGLDGRLRARRENETPFDPARGFHATRIEGRLRVKGAAEVVAERCARVRTGGREQPLDDRGRRRLLEQAADLAADGYRVLMVAEGPPDDAPDDAHDLTALGYVGISDPLKHGVPAAVRRCQEAGVRVVMLTGDHPATALAIAREAGLADGEASVVTGAELFELSGAELAERLEHASVVARSTPLTKLRIVEALKGRGHVVAMTGDGVNDAPALRLADVGVAMGEAGTEVARQASDVIVTDDDFTTLVEALVEGRGFWANMRSALGLLLGGNVGELAVMTAAAVTGLAAPLNARQVLFMNLLTDVLPAVALAARAPENRDLSRLAREGPEAIDSRLRDDILRRGAATGLPTIAAYVVALRRADLPAARSVAFASVVSGQLAQTLDIGAIDNGGNGVVAGAVAGSAALLAASIAVPSARGFLGFGAPGLGGIALISAATASAVAIGRSLRALDASQGTREETGS